MVVPHWLRPTVFLLLFLNSYCVGSNGDQSPFYQKCTERCVSFNCTANSNKFETSNFQALINHLLRWSCQDECRYGCMWKTVHSFTGRGWATPKFHGKWPFLRVLGIQEIGSVIGSILNLVAHAFMYNEMVSRFSPKNTPLLWMWKTFALVCANGWLWSIIFHTRDTLFTEFMDYACAMSMIMALLITCGLRLFHSKRLIYSWIFAIVCIFVYINHVLYLYEGRIDYEYNMFANIVFGVLACLSWSVWAFYKYWKWGQTYVWRIIAFNVLTAVFMTLELYDFPPYLDIWDAHAMWHMSTSILPLIFYRFVFDDLEYLQQSRTELLLPKAYNKRL